MDPSSHGIRTRSQSQSRTPPPPPEGTANTPFVGTPPHHTDKPWTEVVMTGVTTPLTAARPSSKPAHPFKTTNQFTPLSSTNDDSTDDGSGQSGDKLLTPADGDVVVQLDGARKIAAVATIALERTILPHSVPPLQTTLTQSIPPLHRPPRVILPSRQLTPLHRIAHSR